MKWTKGNNARGWRTRTEPILQQFDLARKILLCFVTPHSPLVATAIPQSSTSATLGPFPIAANFSLAADIACQSVCFVPLVWGRGVMAGSMLGREGIFPSSTLVHGLGQGIRRCSGIGKWMLSDSRGAVELDRKKLPTTSGRSELRFDFIRKTRTMAKTDSH